MALLEAGLGLVGSVVDKIFGDSAAEKQADLQKEFAQHGIRWKVKDAQKAGIHPLYALGANTMSYAPVSVGTDFASVGQNLGRAIDAGRTSDEKGSAFEKTVQELTLQKMGLENDLLASQIRTINQPGHPPTRPGGSSVAVTPGSMTGGGGDVRIEVNPGNTPAQDWENQYGEIGGEIGGLANFVNDLAKTHLGVSSPNELGQKIRQWLVETGSRSYAAKPKQTRSYTPYRPASSGARRYTFVP